MVDVLGSTGASYIWLTTPAIYRKSGWLWQNLAHSLSMYLTQASFQAILAHLKKHLDLGFVRLNLLDNAQFLTTLGVPVPCYRCAEVCLDKGKRQPR